ncbi:MAG: hypothetical protein M3Y42_18470, partial [Actinomycetota bacterium]|nr:hypothetical protein [Actinomycetota bacterium]
AGGAGAGTGNGGAAGGATSGGGPKAGTAKAKVNPVTGQLETVAAAGSGAGADIEANPMDLADSSRAGSNTPFAILAVALLLLALITPPLLTHRLARAKETR